LTKMSEKPFQIGDHVMDNRVVLAPMAGICNSAFRLTVKEFGAGLVYAEMISDKGIVQKNQKTMGMLYIDERENPLSLQIFGGDKERSSKQQSTWTKIRMLTLLISIWVALFLRLLNVKREQNYCSTQIRFMKWLQQ